MTDDLAVVPFDIGCRVRDTITGKRKNRGTGVIEKVWPGRGPSGEWPYFVIIKWDAGGSKSDRNIRRLLVLE